jgi:hypothetical protein
MVRRNITIDSSNAYGEPVGVCKTYGRVCTAYKNHVCQRWKWAGGMYGDGVTIGMTWNGHYRSKKTRPYNKDFDTCKFRLEERVLKPCRVDMWNKHPNKDSLILEACLQIRRSVLSGLWCRRGTVHQRCGRILSLPNRRASPRMLPAATS